MNDAEQSVAPFEEEGETKPPSADELKRILAKHAAWLDDSGSGGARADFSDALLDGVDLSGAALNRANLKSAHLQNAKLSHAELRWAQMEKADLTQAELQNADFGWTQLQEAVISNADARSANLYTADLRGATLIGTDFQGARLVGARLDPSVSRWQEDGQERTEERRTNVAHADFRGSDLSDADLSDVVGLQAQALAGAALTNAKLPEAILKFEGLAHVAEIAKIARPIFLALLLGCVYGWLTIGKTTDASLVTNSSASSLPIIETEIPIVAFYWVAPLVLLAIYFYFHLYLQRLWSGLARLPAIFTDGEALHEKAHPWLIGGIVQAHSPRLWDRGGAFAALENAVAVVLAWWIVPLTLVGFWLRYLPRHDWWGTLWHLALIVIAIEFGVASHRRAVGTLSSLGYREGRSASTKLWLAAGQLLQSGLRPVTLLLCALLALTSAGAIEGDPRPEPAAPFTGWIPTLLESFGYRAYADLTEAEVSLRPEDWWKDEDPKRVINRANLQNADLRYAQAHSAFLVQADLRGAWLMGADLRESLLMAANLKEANLRDAELDRAALQGANLSGAYLWQARLFEAQMQGTILTGARLQKADLGYIEAEGAKFIGARLQDADFRYANLQNAILGEARMERVAMGGARLQNADLRGSKLTEAYAAHAQLQNAVLEFASLQGAKLNEANLRGAKLKNAQLDNTNLERARLEGADLHLAHGLTQTQLDQACGDEQTRLPDGLMIPMCADFVWAQD